MYNLKEYKMSEQVTIFGKTKRIKFNTTEEEFFKERIEAKRQKGKLHIEYDPSAESYKEFYLWNFDDIVFFNNEAWELVEKQDLEYFDFFKVLKNEDETYTFITSFHNGGTCLNEMLEEGLKDFKRKSENKTE